MNITVVLQFFNKFFIKIFMKIPGVLLCLSADFWTKLQQKTGNKLFENVANYLGTIW
jgi:hypothetical protein